MARHFEAGALRDRDGGIFKHAPRHLHHPSTGIAPDVLVVPLSEFVVHLAVPQVDAMDDAVSLETGDRAEDGRIVGRTQLCHHGPMELVDRPEMPIISCEQALHLVADWTGPCHAPSIRKNIAQVACAILLRNETTPESRVSGGRTLAGTRIWGIVALVLAVALSACGGSTPAAQTGPIKVVAGQNFWGSIATQLGGTKASVQSVVTDPNADPHEYESNTNDARAFADAGFVILNGAGYDDWATRLLSANPSSHRTVLVAADLLGKQAGDNPHFWYNPDYVTKMADQITADYKSIDSADATYFDQQRAGFTYALKPYTQRLVEIKSRFSGVRVGATESIFVYMATALGLNLISPPEFMQAVAEGNDPPASAVVDFQNQITGKQVKVLVYNVQTATAVTTNVKHLAALADIPVVGVSETLQPESATFQDWQLSQLLALQNALNASALTS